MSRKKTNKPVKSRTWPQYLQWCFLFSKVKVSSQLLHREASLSGTQVGGSEGVRG